MKNQHYKAAQILQEWLFTTRTLYILGSKDLQKPHRKGHIPSRTQEACASGEVDFQEDFKGSDKGGEEGTPDVDLLVEQDVADVGGEFDVDEGMCGPENGREEGAEVAQGGGDEGHLVCAG